MFGQSPKFVVFFSPSLSSNLHGWASLLFCKPLRFVTGCNSDNENQEFKFQFFRALCLSANACLINKSEWLQFSTAVMVQDENVLNSCWLLFSLFSAQKVTTYLI